MIPAMVRDGKSVEFVEEVMITGRYELVAKNPNYFFRKKTALNEDEDIDAIS